MRAYTKLVEAGGHAHRARGLQRLPAAALRGPRDHHRVLPRARDRAAQHQPAAPHLPQGDRGGDDDAVDLPAHRLPPRGHRRPPARRLPHRRTSAARSTRRCARARTSRRCGSTCSPATSPGSPPTTRAARTRPSSASPATTSSSPSRASAAPSTSCPGMISEGRKRGLSYNRDRRARRAQPRRAASAWPARATIAVGLRRRLLPGRRRRRLRRARRGLAVRPRSTRRSRASSSPPGDRHLPARRAGARATAPSSATRAASSSAGRGNAARRLRAAAPVSGPGAVEGLAGPRTTAASIEPAVLVGGDPDRRRPRSGRARRAPRATSSSSGVSTSLITGT